MNDKKKMILVLSLVVALVGHSGLEYFLTVRKERKKRKQIDLWQEEMLGFIASSRDRVSSMLADPNVPFEDGIRAWREDQQFIKLMFAQKPKL